MSDYIVTAKVNPSNLELERTPGEAAVSQQTEKAGCLEVAPGTSPSFSGAAETNSPPSPDSGISDSYNHSLKRCGSMAVFTECDNGHRHGKVLYCGVDWCPDCGKEGSKAHNRRISSWLKKFEQIETLGYLVIEWPDSYRHNLKYLYSQAGISRINRIVKDVLAGVRGKGNKRSGGWFPDGGLGKWHWFGDRCINAKYQGNKITICKINGHQCPKNHKNCEQFVNDGKLNQHLNIAVFGRYLPPEELEQLKLELKEALNCPKLIVEYQYFTINAQKYQKLSYITRPTFLKREWDHTFANELYNFRSNIWWGKWKGPKVWEVTPDMKADGFEYASELGAGICPVDGCHLKLHKWSRPISTKLMLSWGASEVGDTGYYRIPYVSRVWESENELTPDKVRRLQQLETENRKSSRKYSKTVGGNYLPISVAANRFEQFKMQHQRFIKHRQWMQSLAEDEETYFDEVIDDGDSP